MSQATDRSELVNVMLHCSTSKPVVGRGWGVANLQLFPLTRRECKEKDAHAQYLHSGNCSLFSSGCHMLSAPTFGFWITCFLVVAMWLELMRRRRRISGINTKFASLSILLTLEWL